MRLSSTTIRDFQVYSPDAYSRVHLLVMTVEYYNCFSFSCIRNCLTCGEVKFKTTSAFGVNVACPKIEQKRVMESHDHQKRVAYKSPNRYWNLRHFSAAFCFIESLTQRRSWCTSRPVIINSLSPIETRQWIDFRNASIISSSVLITTA